MARTFGRSGVKEVPPPEIKDDLSRYPREAETQYRLENDPRFLRRIEQARKSLHAGHGVRLEDIEQE
jgi:hypothetical protein